MRSAQKGRASPPRNQRDRRGAMLRASSKNELFVVNPVEMLRACTHKIDDSSAVADHVRVAVPTANSAATDCYLRISQRDRQSLQLDLVRCGRTFRVRIERSRAF